MRNLQTKKKNWCHFYKKLHRQQNRIREPFSCDCQIDFISNDTKVYINMYTCGKYSKQVYIIQNTEKHIQPAETLCIWTHISHKN